MCLIHTSIKAMTIRRKSCPIADNNVILVNIMCPHEWATAVNSVRMHVVNAVSSAAGFGAVTLLRIYPWNEWLAIQWKITTIKLQNQSVCDNKSRWSKIEPEWQIWCESRFIQYWMCVACGCNRKIGEKIFNLWPLDKQTVFSLFLMVQQAWASYWRHATANIITYNICVGHFGEERAFHLMRWLVDWSSIRMFSSHHFLFIYLFIHSSE